MAWQGQWTSRACIMKDFFEIIEVPVFSCFSLFGSFAYVLRHQKLNYVTVWVDLKFKCLNVDLSTCGLIWKSIFSSLHEFLRFWKKLYMVLLLLSFSALCKGKNWDSQLALSIPLLPFTNWLSIWFSKCFNWNLTVICLSFGLVASELS